jgi:hypothetical protein
MEVYEGLEVQLHSFLTLLPDGDEQSASRPSEEKPPPVPTSYAGKWPQVPSGRLEKRNCRESWLKSNFVTTKAILPLGLPPSFQDSKHVCQQVDDQETPLCRLQPVAGGGSKFVHCTSCRGFLYPTTPEVGECGRCLLLFRFQQGKFFLAFNLIRSFKNTRITKTQYIPHRSHCALQIHT